MDTGTWAHVPVQVFRRGTILVFKRAKANEVPVASARRPRMLLRLLRDRCGAAAVLTALCMPIVVGFAGFAVEIGLNYSQKRLLQSAADSGAIGGAMINYMSGTNAQIQAAIVADIATNLGGTGDSSAQTVTVGGTAATVEWHNPPINGGYTSNGTGVEVILTQPQNVLMSRLFTGNSTQNIRVRAVAISSSAPGKSCILSLEPSSIGVKDAGNPKLTLKNCGLASNSSNEATSLTMNGNKGLITADWVHLSGSCSNCTVGSNLKVSAANYVTNGARIGDPFQDYAAPTAPAASYSNPMVSGNQNVTLSPGTYSNGISITGGTTTFSPGVYAVSGSLKISGGTVSGSGVTFVINNGASVSIQGNASITLTAPTAAFSNSTGSSSAGMLFYGKNASTKNNDISFAGTATQNLTGALYFPKSNVAFSGTNDSGTSKVCTNIVALTVDLVGSNTGTLDCSADTNEPVPPTFPYLVE